jgi:hypothetical protein
MQEQYDSVPTPTQMFPPKLLAEVVKINYIRLQTKVARAFDEEDLSQEAYSILDRIQAFSSEQSAQSRSSSREDWNRIGKVFKSATVLYCILSLQSVSVLPENPVLRSICTNHSQVLQHYLPDSLSSAKTKRFMLWPLVLLGVEAVHSDSKTHAFVSKHLPEMSQAVGTSIPLTARTVLESFWKSGNKRWDDCFDRPYPFTMQIAVDVSRVSAS